MHLLTFMPLLALLVSILTSCGSLPNLLGGDAMHQTSLPEAENRIRSAHSEEAVPSNPSVDSETHSTVVSETLTTPEQTELVIETDLWQRIRNGFTLSHEVDRKRVQAELKWFVKHPEYIDRVAKRATPHLYYIVSELERRGLPLEFALLPVIESAFDPFAYSHGRAAGLWQFIPATARVYGLKIDWWYDGRRDVRASTTAAIDYLAYLHNMFNGDWLLALASYNAGQGNVLSSIRASKLDRSEINYWTIKVLRETHTYVPRLLALAELIANPAQYHINLPEIPNAPYWQVVDTISQIDLNKAAELASVPKDVIYSLNAGFNQWATHPDGPHELILPIDKVDLFNVNLSNLTAQQRVSWVRHQIKPGETLGTLADRYRTTVATIKRTNNIKGSMIKAGQSLLISAPNSTSHYSMSKSGRLESKHQYLENTYGSEPTLYIVKPGDSFWDISRKYDVGMRELASWNGMGTTGVLQAGTELKIFLKQSIPTTNKERVRKLSYRVREGESLSLIANKFNVSIKNIVSWNKALTLKKYIYPGDNLTLYVDVTALIN